MQKLLPLLQGRVGLFVVDEAHCMDMVPALRTGVAGLSWLYSPRKQRVRRGKI